MPELARLIKDAKGVIAEDVAFHPGEMIEPNLYNLGKFSHGALGDTYLVLKVIIDKGDVPQILKKALESTVMQENIGLLTRGINSKSRTAEDIRTNKSTIEASTELLKEFKKAVVRKVPLHNNDELKALNGKSEVNVAILKLISSEELLGRPHLKEDMIRETENMSRVKNEDHSNIARYDSTVIHPKGIGYVVELLDGRNGKDLGNDAVVKRISDLPGNAVISAYGYCTFNALATMHNKNLTHNDAKPANFMLVLKNGVWKLVDLGLSREFEPGKQNYTEKFASDIGYAGAEVVEQVEKGMDGSGARVIAKNRYILNDKKEIDPKVIEELKTKGIDVMDISKVMVTGIKQLIVSPGKSAKLEDLLKNDKTLARMQQDGIIINVARVPYGPETDVRMGGASMYEFATGKLTCRESDINDFIKAVTETDPKPASHYNSNLSTKVNGIIMQCLSKNPSNRPTAAAARDMLAEELAKMGYKTVAAINEVSRKYAAPILDERTKKYVMQEAEEKQDFPQELMGSVSQA